MVKIWVCAYYGRPTKFISLRLFYADIGHSM